MAHSSARPICRPLTSHRARQVSIQLSVNKWARYTQQNHNTYKPPITPRLSLSHRRTRLVKPTCNSWPRNANYFLKRSRSESGPLEVSKALTLSPNKIQTCQMARSCSTPLSTHRHSQTRHRITTNSQARSTLTTMESHRMSRRRSHMEELTAIHMQVIQINWTLIVHHRCLAGRIFSKARAAAPIDEVHRRTSLGKTRFYRVALQVNGTTTIALSTSIIVISQWASTMQLHLQEITRRRMHRRWQRFYHSNQ